MHVIPRPQRIDATGAALPAFGTWRVEAATPELEPLAATARQLLDAHVTDTRERHRGTPHTRAATPLHEVGPSLIS